MCTAHNLHVQLLTLSSSASLAHAISVWTSILPLIHSEALLTHSSSSSLSATSKLSWQVESREKLLTTTSPTTRNSDIQYSFCEGENDPCFISWFVYWSLIDAEQGNYIVDFCFHSLKFDNYLIQIWIIGLPTRTSALISKCSSCLGPPLLNLLTNYQFYFIPLIIWLHQSYPLPLEHQKLSHLMDVFWKYPYLFRHLLKSLCQNQFFSTISIFLKNDKT